MNARVRGLLLGAVNRRLGHGILPSRQRRVPGGRDVARSRELLKSQSSLSSRARETASGRVATSSLRKMLLTCVLTVLNET